MQSIDTGYRYIREGVVDLILAGGTEALSYAPLVWPNAGVRWFAGLAGATSTFCWGLEVFIAFERHAVAANLDADFLDLAPQHVAELR